MKTSSRPILRAVLGIAALVVIAVAANWLMQLSSIGKSGADFTEHRIHTLQDGTKAILQDLDAPVYIRYYATKKSESMPRELKLYMRKVEDVLRRYVALSDGKIRLETLDPQPDTDAEDAAAADGMQGQRVQDGTYEENIFHGVAISCLDKTETIPFLYPNEETRLEYELSRAIAQVSQPKKPKIGVMSALQLSGAPAQMPGQSPQQPWVIYQQLEQTYEVENLGMTPEEIDPEELTAVVLIHPAGITPAVEFLLDQYVLQGGTLVACLDPFSHTAQQMGGGNPMMGMGGAPTSSTLPTLLDGWGVAFEDNQVVADRGYATPLQDGRIGVGILTLPPESMPQREDDLITQELQSLWMIFPGGFTVTGGKGAKSTSLIRSTRNTALVDGYRASQVDQSLLTSMGNEDKAYDFVVHLSGTFKTAFPQGDPDNPEEEETGEEDAEDAEDAEAAEGAESEADDGAEEEDETPSSLKEGAKPGNVFLIADVDFLYDRYAYQPFSIGNMRMYSPTNGNSTLLFNILDQAAGSEHLIGARSRASTRRPFTLVNEMEERYERKFGEEEAKLKEKLDDTNARLSQLQSQLPEGSNIMRNPQVQAEMKKLQLEAAEVNRQIRELQKDLKREKDQLSAQLTLLNLAVVPIIVAMIGITVLARRRAAAAAR